MKSKLSFIFLFMLSCNIDSNLSVLNRGESIVYSKAENTTAFDIDLNLKLPDTHLMSL